MKTSHRINTSELECRRFKMNIARAHMESLDIKCLSKFILENRTDITILRLPCEKLNQVSKLNQMGFPFYQTDTLVYYSTNFEKYVPQKLRNADLNFRLATDNDNEIISTLVDEIFPGYTNHYNSNPYIDKNGIIDGYKEWVLNFIGAENKFVFIVQREGKDIGFASCSIIDGIGEGVLYGVMPYAAGGGVYTDIIRYTQNFMIESGIKEMKVSTQVQNYAVQKVWSREGFFLTDSYATFHINSLLEFSVTEPKKYELSFSEKDIEQAGELSGDFNPIHFDNEYAHKIGLEKVITHGLLANADLSKFFGTIYPGDGTLFMGYKYNFLRPIYPDEVHQVEITTPFLDEKRQIYFCVVKIFNQKGEICLIAFNDLLKKK